MLFCRSGGCGLFGFGGWFGRGLQGGTKFAGSYAHRGLLFSAYVFSGVVFGHVISDLLVESLV
jgi:hypothetical protein